MPRANPPDIIPYLRINQTDAQQNVSRAQLRQWYSDNYGPQVIYLDHLVQQTVGRILAQSPSPPVIIIQGDHGAGQITSRDPADPGQLPRRLSILNAIHLPPAPNPSGETLYPTITPVNTFRIILSRYLDTTLAPLPDKSYFSTIMRPFLLLDIDDSASYASSDSHLPPRQKLAVIAYTTARAPSRPAQYCRQLVQLQYPAGTSDTAPRYECWKSCVKTVPQPLTPDQAYLRYQQAVRDHQLPDYGSNCQTYTGPGPDRRQVTALYFKL